MTTDRFSINPQAGCVKRDCLPKHLKRRLSLKTAFQDTVSCLQDKELNTVCQEAHCPNMTECYAQGTATFLLLGKECTRSCAFCSIGFHKAPPLPDEEEQIRLVDTVNALGLHYVVLTMVTRDDLLDGGSSYVAQTIRLLFQAIPHIQIEVLTSDFEGKEESLRTILSAQPTIFNHNVETVERLTPKVRHKATYDRSLEVLLKAKQLAPSIPTKSGLMVGLGEKDDEVHRTLLDLHRSHVSIVTIGQYLQPSKRNCPVCEFISPEKFQSYQEFGLSIGIPHIFSGPFVRSSYHARDVILKERNKSTN